MSTEYSAALRLTANTSVIDELDRKLNSVQRTISSIQGMNLGGIADRRAQQAVESQVASRLELVSAIRQSNAELVAESNLLRQNARLARNYASNQGRGQSTGSRGGGEGLSETAARGRQLAEALEQAGRAQERAFGNSARAEVQQYTTQLQQARGQVQSLVAGLQQVTGTAGRTPDAPLDTGELQRQIVALENQVQQLTRIQRSMRDATEQQRQQSQQTQEQETAWRRLGAATDAVMDRQLQGERSLLQLRQQSLDLVTGTVQKAKSLGNQTFNLATGTDLASRGKRGLLAGGLAMGAAAYSGVGDALGGITSGLTSFTGVGSRAANQIGEKLVDAASGMGDAINASLHGAPELINNIGHMVAQHPGLWGAAAVALAAFGDKIPGVIKDTADLTVKINEATGATDKLAGAANAVAQATKDMAQGNLNMPFKMADGVAKDILDQARGPVVQALPAYRERGLQDLGASDRGNYLDTLNAYKEGLATKRTELNVTKAITEEQTRGARFQEALNRESKRQRNLGIDGGFDSNALLPKGMSAAAAGVQNAFSDAAAAAAKVQQELAESAAEAARLQAALKPSAEIQWNWAQALRQGREWQADMVQLQQKETQAIRDSVQARQLELRALETEQKIQAALVRNEQAQKRREGIKAGVGAGLAMANLPGQQIFQAAAIGGAVGGGWGAAAGAITGTAVALGQFGVESAKVAINVTTLEKRLEFLSAGFDSYGQVMQQAQASGAKFGQTQAESLEAFSKTYGRLRPMGMSLEQITTIYEGFNTAAKLSGATAAESAGAYTQLIQAMGAGALRGEELNSVLEQAPMVSQAIAKELGTTVGKLKQFAEEGQITGEVVMRALQKVRDEGGDKLAASLDTPAAKLKQFEVAWEKLQVTLTKALIPAIASSIESLAGIIDSLAPHIQAIAELAASTMAGIQDLINVATKPQEEAAKAAIKNGRLPMVGLGGISGAEKLFLGTSGASGEGLTGLKKEAAELAKLRNQAVTDVLIELMQNRLKKMEAATKAPVQQVSNVVWDGKGPDPKAKKESGKSEAEKELERQEKLNQAIYKDQLQIDEQLMRNQVELDETVFRHRQDLERQLFDYKSQLQQQELDNWVSGLTGAARDQASIFAKFANDRRQDDGRRIAMLQDIEAAEKRIAAAKLNVALAQRSAVAEAAGFAPGSAGAGNAVGGKVVQHLHGDPGRVGYDKAGHGTEQNAHDHFAFDSEATTRKVMDGLKKLGYVVTEFGVKSGHSDGSLHYQNRAFDVPWSQFGSGAIGQQDFARSRQLQADVQRLVGGGAAPAQVAGQGGMDSYLKRLSYLETRLRNIPNSEGSDAQGYFQAMPAFTREAVSASGGLSPRSGDYEEAKKSVAAWIAKHRPEAFAAIQAGNYDRADAALRPTWPSLPGGTQAQPPEVQAKARQFLAPAGSDISPLAGQAGVASAEGGLQQAMADLDMFQEKYAAFMAAQNEGAGEKVKAMVLASTEAFRSQTAELGNQTEALQLRNRLELEGVSPEVINGELQKLDVSQRLAEKLEAADEALANNSITQEQYAESTAKIKEAAEGAAGAIDKMTTASVAAADPVAQLIKQWNADLNNSQAMVASLAGTVQNELGSAMSSAITGLIDGTQTAEQAFSQMFKNIGKAFLDMAMQMIAKALVMKVLGILNPGSSGPGAGLGDPAMFADGGFVNSTTNAIIGEGGSSEYVIPENKMGSAMSRWSSGARGDAVLNGADPTGGGAAAPEGEAPSQVNISGGVLHFNDSQYIRADQIPSIISQGAKQGEARALRKLQMSPGTRRKVGI